MAVVVGFDIHREQITFDALDEVTGEVWRGRIAPADRLGVRCFLRSLPADRIDVALEATTGWRFIVEELVAAGATAHLAEPAETANLRGRQARAKTDRTDARYLRELLQQGRLPEAWAPPEEILELRQRVRLRKTLVDERTAWQQRIHALLFHHGIQRPRALLTREGRASLQQLELSPSARQALDVALAMIDACEAQLAPLDRELRRYAHRQAGCLALMRMFGVGALTSAAILAELGDTRRFSSSRHAVRFAGLDVTVYSSDARRSPGRLSRQGSSVLRWAVYEAAQTAARLARPRVLPDAGGATGEEPRQSRARRASCCAAPITSSASSATPRSAPRLNQLRARFALIHSDAVRPTPEKLLPTRPLAGGP